MKKIVALTSSFGELTDSQKKQLDRLDLGITLNPHGRKVTSEELLSLAKDAVGVIAGLETYDANVLAKLSGLRLISRVGVGIDAIDLEACKKRNIQVFTTADAVIEPVAELTVGFILNLLRQIESQSVNLKAGSWKRGSGSLLEGKTIGIVGLGRIGRRVAELLRPFRSRLIASDLQSVSCSGVEQVAFEKLISQADIITLHCNSSLKAKPLIDHAVFSKMKKGALLINTARGSLIDEAALASALSSGHLAGAALDVFSEEPYQGPLCKAPNVILTPHIGSFTAESRKMMEAEALDNLIKGLECK